VAVTIAAGTSDPEPLRPSEPAGLAIPFAGVAAVVIAAARLGRPTGLIAAGAGLVPMTLVSFAGLGLLFVPVAIYLVVAGFRRLEHESWLMSALIPVVGFLLTGSFFALFATEDPISWSSANASGSSSDHITWHEAALSFALATAALALTALPRPASARPDR